MSINTPDPCRPFRWQASRGQTNKTRKFNMATNLTRIQSDNEIKRGSSPTASEARGWGNLVRISDLKSAHNASRVEGGFYLFFFLQRGFICRILKPFSPRIPRLLGNMVVTHS